MPLILRIPHYQKCAVFCGTQQYVKMRGLRHAANAAVWLWCARLSARQRRVLGLGQVPASEPTHTLALETFGHTKGAATLVLVRMDRAHTRGKPEK